MRRGGLDWHWDPSVTPWPLATLPSSLSPPPEALELQGLYPFREGAENT